METDYGYLLTEYTKNPNLSYKFVLSNAKKSLMENQCIIKNIDSH